MIDELTKYNPESDVGTVDLVYQTAFDDLHTNMVVRDCLKVSCVCCKGSSHSIILNGIEEFPPTADNK